MQNFRLKLELGTPFFMTSRLTLDGLLSAAVFYERGLRGKDTIPYIPLEQSDGIFKGSSLFCEPNYRHENFGRIMSLRSERDLRSDLFSPNKRGNKYGPIDQQRGDYKANMSSYAGIAAKEVYFWGVGDPERAAYLIETYIPGIGKRANIGAGQIMSVSWSEVDDDRSWTTRKGTPARPLPLDLWIAMGGDSAAATAPLAITLPYWEEQAVEAVFPVSLVV